jgi:hypothetical protein
LTILTLLLLAVALVSLGVAWWVPSDDRRHVILAAAGVGGLSLALLMVLFDGASSRRPVEVDLALLLSGSLAVVGGGPVTVAVFRLVDRGQPATDSVQGAGDVLRGGAWIGGLERAAVLVSLLAGWPEGIAVVLALKGIARYPELRGHDDDELVLPHGVAERFIIGTFVSVLWAVACAGMLLD